MIKVYDNQMDYLILKKIDNDSMLLIENNELTNTIRN